MWYLQVQLPLDLKVLSPDRFTIVHIYHYRYYPLMKQSKLFKNCLEKESLNILLGKLNIESIRAFIGGHPRSIEVLYRFLIEWTKKTPMIISNNFITTFHSKIITEINRW